MTNSSTTEAQIEAGQAVYTKRTLAAYDLVVLGISNRWIWRCPTGRLLAEFDRHISTNHLDVGVGTGYFLDKCRFPEPHRRIALMDLNQDALQFAARRIARYHPQIHRQDVLKPLNWQAERFDTVSMNYLLHCLPGSLNDKSVVLDHLADCMNANGMLFGSTILHEGVKRGRMATRLMRFYNARGIFSNQRDSLDELKRELHRRFRDVTVEVVGCVAIFHGRTASS